LLPVEFLGVPCVGCNTEYYPHEDHKLVFDNAFTHLMCSGTVLLACHMPKGTKAVGEFWGAEIPVLDSDGKQVYQHDQTGKLTQKPLKVKVPMDNVQFKDGSPQQLYYPHNHAEQPGYFKGMAVLLEEHKLMEEFKL